MPAQTVRTTLTLPVELLEAAVRAVRTGRARSRNELVARALRHELAALERAAVDAAFATLGDDPDHEGVGRRGLGSLPSGRGSILRWDASTRHWYCWTHRPRQE